MTEYLPKPVTDKDTTDGENKSIMFAASKMQGWRTSKNAVFLEITN